MNDARRAFLDDLLETATPAGFETAGQRVWLDYLEPYADELRVDAYGNAVAVHQGTGTLSVALTGHGDEIGFMIRAITEEGFLRLARVGGSDRTVTRGQHVTVHADDPVPGVVGQMAIHMRDVDDDTVDDISDMYVDIGAADGEEARELVNVGDPVTFASTARDLAGDRVAARGMDNRTGIWAAAEAFRRATERDADATVYAVSTVQEELGKQGAKMVGFDLNPDIAVAVDVTHATDTPDTGGDVATNVELGDGPAVSRGSSNHPHLVNAVREVAAAEDIDVQLQAQGSSTGTDADAFYTARGGIPSLNVSIPNRYMHTPVEVVDLTDLDDVAELVGAFAARAGSFAPYAVDV